MLRFLPERHTDRVFPKLPIIYAATDTVPEPGSLYFQPSTPMTVLEDLGRTLASRTSTEDRVTARVVRSPSETTSRSMATETLDRFDGVLYRVGRVLGT